MLYLIMHVYIVDNFINFVAYIIILQNILIHVLVRCPDVLYCEHYVPYFKPLMSKYMCY